LGGTGLQSDTVARQLVTSADSIPANLSEGDGRYSDGEAIHFFYIARASARELLNWISVALERNLISQDQSQRWVTEINGATQELNNLINYRKANKNVRAVREERADYGTDQTEP
jgi:four helix bundle protein